MKEKLLKHKSKIILIGIILISILLYFFNPSIKGLVNNISAMFASGDFEVVRDFIDEYGAYAMLVSAALMVFQSVVAPLPAFLITFANANLFGWWQGAILSWSSAMLGALLCFYISRILGRDMVEKLTSKAGLESIDSFFEKYGKHSILIARLLPFMSFDIVSYAAGLTSMAFIPFFIATGIGQLPATIVYSYVGGMLTGGAQLLVTGLLILFALSIFIVLIRSIYHSREANKVKEKGNER
ncbi:TVP38/TMEM64 family protein [Alkaliphilus sp. MSJ-5]|uniref:TVP38/TMEM64 family membrane protein n=1 Tax=Alkaliphilus flagellatus TaxID=2841507 RepID=A0ABS6FZQ1_9FIRM|nr:TVP38/TMEM64 family protein [Alkaliphilus flagellatus]MBU5675729.1 TVP38/TMEM64 family protein [Alkaliphilus flagellatus]